MDFEKHLQDFYNYIVENEDKIKYEVRKNITYDEELFNDVYSDTIIKVAESIINKHKVIEDFRYYFFISFKQNYIQSQNKKRKFEKIFITSESITDSSDDAFESEDFTLRMKCFFKWLADYLEGFFKASEVDIYIIYYRLKVGTNRISYKKLAKITKKDVKEITNIIQNIKKFISKDQIIKEKKEEILYGTDFVIDTELY